MSAVLGIDHVELFVPDRFKAAAWYEKALGLQIIPEHREWASDPRGPLMISCGDGTKLALFEGEPPASKAAPGFRRVAFGVTGSGFLEFLKGVSEEESLITTADDPVVDHERAYSIYFTDPWGHLLEVTTYDYQEVTKALEEYRRGAS